MNADMRIPEIELSECIRCGVCIDLCPEVFALADAGYVFVSDLPDYPEACIDEAIKNCPVDCINWLDY